MTLCHPLDFVPASTRKPLFIMLLIWALVLMVVMQVLGRPLQTEAAPAGIVSFELAGSPDRAMQILASWDPHYNPTLGYSVVEFYTAPLYAAFGLGLDYLFMPSYAAAIALGVLLAAGRHKGWFTSLGAILGWGALAAALLDAVENIALWRELLGAILSPWPMVAATCARVKFALILLGIAYALAGWILPKRRSPK